MSGEPGGEIAVLDIMRFSELMVSDSSMSKRWSPPDHKPWALVFVRVHFIDDGSSSSSADMTISVCEDVTRDAVQTHKTLLARIVGAGVGNDVNYRVAEDELIHHFIREGWGVQIDWTHPDPGDIFWGLEIGYVLQDDFVKRAARG